MTLKTRRTVYIIIGSILILLNLLVDLVALMENDIVSESQGYSLGYFLGSHFLLIIGLVFLRLAYRLNRRIKKTTGNELEDSIKSIGENQAD